ncbi:TniQ family protein [Streptomyces sp. PB17]|uniref:TniQ family protein n=1 Tax=Streptomyces sp. PB17 TaxID=3384158 RepID=UPI0038B4F0AA
MTSGTDAGDRLRLLPVRPRPKAGETTDSYVRRLARANHLKPSYLRGYLVGPPDYGQGKRPRADRLAAVTGRRQDVLERALVDLARQKRPEPTKPKRHVTSSADKPALFAAIRRDAEQGSPTIRSLAARHRVSPHTVRLALASPTPPPRKQRPAIAGPAKGRVGPVIDAILDEHAARHAGQLPTVRLVWERLLDEHDADVSYGTVHRYMSSHPLKNRGTMISQPDSASGDPLSEAQRGLHIGVFKHYQNLVTAVRREPARHGLDGTFATATAFVLGLDAGTSGSMLTGFREWLVVRLNRDHNLTWPALVRHLAPSGWTHPLTPRADTEAVITLHRLLAEFFDAREHPDSLAKIFRDYQSWPTTRPWSETASLDQIN